MSFVFAVNVICTVKPRRQIKPTTINVMLSGGHQLVFLLQQQQMQINSTHCHVCFFSCPASQIIVFCLLLAMRSGGMSFSQFSHSSQRAIHPPTTPPAVLSGGPVPSPPITSVRETDVFLQTLTSDAMGRSRSLKSVDTAMHVRDRQGRPRSRTSPERRGKQVSQVNYFVMLMPHV